MIPARALVYAVLVALVNSILIAAILTLFTMTESITDEQLNKTRAIRNVQSGLEQLLDYNDQDTTITKLDLFGDGKDFVDVGAFNWGLFKAGFARAFPDGQVHKDTISKAILMGAWGNKSMKPALSVADNNTPLFVSGPVEICGDALVGSAGIREGYVGGVGYTGKAMVRGAIGRSSPDVFNINQRRLREVIDGFERLPAEPLPVSGDIGQSFMRPTLCFVSEGMILEHRNIRGNVLLKSGQRIVVRASCVIEDAILVAPEIRIEDGTRGHFQAYASHKIDLGRETKLEYPSVLCLLREHTGTDTLSINLQETARVEGLILAWQLAYSSDPIQVNIPKGATVAGQVFADAVVNLQGDVVGNLTCSRLAYSTGGMFLGNYIVGAKIDRCRLSEKYLSPFFEQEITRRKVLKWLY